MKHTPGPWKSEKLGPLAKQPTWRIFAVNNKDEVRDVITDVYGGDEIMKDDSESEANANLIAAAPEMLEAIQDLLNILEDENSEFVHYEAFENALRVFRKATGEKPKKDDSEDPFDYGGVGY